MPTLVAGYLCCKWLGNDSKENRSGMACAFLIFTLVQLFACAMFFFAYLNEGKNLMLPITSGIGAALYTYWYSVAKAYESS